MIHLIRNQKVEVVMRNSIRTFTRTMSCVVALLFAAAVQAASPALKARHVDKPERVLFVGGTHDFDGRIGKAQRPRGVLPA
jgi:hypothetical protein